MSGDDQRKGAGAYRYKGSDSSSSTLTTLHSHDAQSDARPERDEQTGSSSENLIYLLRGVPFHASSEDVDDFLAEVRMYTRLDIGVLSDDTCSGNVFVELSTDQCKAEVENLHNKEFICAVDAATYPERRPRPRFVEVIPSNAAQRAQTLAEDKERTRAQATGQQQQQRESDADASRALSGTDTPNTGGSMTAVDAADSAAAAAAVAALSPASGGGISGALGTSSTSSAEFSLTSTAPVIVQSPRELPPPPPQPPQQHQQQPVTPFTRYYLVQHPYLTGSLAAPPNGHPQQLPPTHAHPPPAIISPVPLQGAEHSLNVSSQASTGVAEPLAAVSPPQTYNAPAPPQDQIAFPQQPTPPHYRSQGGPNLYFQHPQR